MHYSIQDIQNIVQNGYDYLLDIVTVNKIADLEKLIADVSTQTQPTTTQKQYVDKKRHFFKDKKTDKSSNEEWKTVRGFKPTVFKKSEGTDNQINEIRIALNKLSNKNLDAQKEALYQNINTLYVEHGINIIEKIIGIIFDIACTNKFYSNIYAELCKYIFDKYRSDVVDSSATGRIECKDVINKLIGIYRDNIHNINYVDPNTNYDGYCAYIKLNDARKASAIFLINLMKQNIIDVSEIYDIITYLQIILHNYIDEPNKSNEIEEITENIFIFTTNGYNELIVDSEKWNKILETIQQFSREKAKEHASLSSRAIFKHLDILDYVKKMA